jgi:small nuclear ribonucleoprotein (snRNP)-like protein
MASALESFVNRQVCIITADGRNFVGTLKGFDQTINVILDDTHERVFSMEQGVEQVSRLRARCRTGAIFLTAMFRVSGCPWDCTSCAGTTSPWWESWTRRWTNG